LTPIGNLVDDRIFTEQPFFALEFTMVKQDALKVTNLGPCKLSSPLKRKGMAKFVPDTARVVYNTEVDVSTPTLKPLLFETAGPREQIFFDPAKTTAAIVTCGGLSPGLNNVIRTAYLELKHNYGVKRVLGIRHGYLGLNPESGLEPIELTSAWVEEINDLGRSP
jgi:6-phosphofructokinase 1